MELYDEYRRVVHRPCSSCISSIQNPMATPLSSPWAWSVIKSSQAKSLQKTEYMAFTRVTAQAVWLTKFLNEIGLPG